MRTIIYCTLFLLLFSCVQNQSIEVELANESVPKIHTLASSTKIAIKEDTIFLNKQRYSGYLYELQPNGLDTLSLQGYCNGVQSGIGKKWFPNNNLMEYRMYRNGKKNGKQTAYWENGNKKFDFLAKEDACEGELKEWNLEGKLIHLATYKNGQENGTQKLWYDNGKIRANYVLIDGKRYGLLGTKNCRNVSDSIFISK